MLKSNKVCFPDLSSTVLTEYNPASFLSEETIGLANNYPVKPSLLKILDLKCCFEFLNFISSRFYNNKTILVLKFRLFIYSYYYGEKVFISSHYIHSKSQRSGKYRQRLF